MNKIKDFYSEIQFPGHYTLLGLQYHDKEIRNGYLNQINSVLKDNIEVLDVGCGTGLVLNLFARKYPASNFTGLDFSESINYAEQFAKDNRINNVSFVKQDFLEYNDTKQYDVVISQGVLHHIPDYNQAFEKIKKLVKPGGCLVVGLYHPYGKILKNFVNINYGNRILHVDQEENPFEASFTGTDVKKIFKEFNFCSVYPSLINSCVALCAILNHKNGGLATYIFKNDKGAT